MIQPSSVPDQSAMVALANAVAHGQRMALGDQVSVGQVANWTSSVRSQLSGVFGSESGVLALWPSANTPFPREQIRQTLGVRIACLQQLVHSVNAAGAGALVPNGVKRVFIGHGRSPVWRELKDFLADRLSLPWDEFNREPVAGIATTERLNQMLDIASFALLVMTAEDEHADSTLHARENVVHEVGLLQGRLGMRRAIILLEDGCKVFSNVHGLSCIPFPSGRISAVFEAIRQVLERERVLVL